MTRDDLQQQMDFFLAPAKCCASRRWARPLGPWGMVDLTWRTIMGIWWGFPGIYWGFVMGTSWGLKKGYILQFHQTSTGDFPMDYPPAIKFRRKIPQISIFPTNLHRVWGFSNGHVWLPEGTVSTVWWFQPTPLKNHGVSKSWDDEIPQLNGKKTCSKPPTRLRWQLGIGTNDNGPGWKR